VGVVQVYQPTTHPFMLDDGDGSSPLPTTPLLWYMVGVVQVLYPCHTLFMMSINATRKIFQMISIAAFFVLFVFT